MTKRIGRPEEFDAAKREKFCTLVGVGVSRRHAATSVGVAPSTVTRHMAADPLFAERVRDAENECEIDLMKRIRLQSERSWRAAVWLLERMRPERYARGKQAAAGPGWDAMFDQFLALIDEEVADESLRQRLTQRLDEMALAELADEEGAATPPTTVASRAKAPPAAARLTAAPAAAPHPSSLQADPAGPAKQSGQDAAKPAMQSWPAASGAFTRSLDQLLARRRDDRLVSNAMGTQQTGPAADFCNTSPDVHERRELKTLSS